MPTWDYLISWGDHIDSLGHVAQVILRVLKNITGSHQQNWLSRVARQRGSSLEPAWT